MMYINIYTDSETSKKVYEIHHVWLYGCKFYSGLGRAERCHHKYILCCSHCKVGSECDIFFVVCSLECNILAFTHILVSVCKERSKVLINRTFPDVTSTWIRYLKGSKSREESRKEEYPNTDLAYLVSVEVFDREIATIHSDSTPIPGYLSTKRFYDREECEDISDFWNIVESEVIKKKSCGYKWESCILGARDFDSTREGLGSGYLEHSSIHICHLEACACTCVGE